MSYKVQIWLFLFRYLRAPYRRARRWWLGHKPTWLILWQYRHVRRNHI
jgi:hypothetical protein